MKKLLTLVCALVLGLGAIALAQEKFPGHLARRAEGRHRQEGRHAARRQRHAKPTRRATFPAPSTSPRRKDTIASKLPKDKGALIVAYCANENCSAYQQGAKAAKELGYTNVKHYAKGIMGWKDCRRDRRKSKFG